MTSRTDLRLPLFRSLHEPWLAIHIDLKLGPVTTFRLRLRLVLTRAPKGKSRTLADILVGSLPRRRENRVDDLVVCLGGDPDRDPAFRRGTNLIWLKLHRSIPSD